MPKLLPLKPNRIFFFLLLRSQVFLQHLPIYKSWALPGREWTFQVGVKYSWAGVNDRAPCPKTSLGSWENPHELQLLFNPYSGCLQLVRKTKQRFFYEAFFPPFLWTKPGKTSQSPFQCSCFGAGRFCKWTQQLPGMSQMWKIWQVRNRNDPCGDFSFHLSLYLIYS